MCLASKPFSPLPLYGIGSKGPAQILRSLMICRTAVKSPSKRVSRAWDTTYGTRFWGWLRYPYKYKYAFAGSRANVELVGRETGWSGGCHPISQALHFLWLSILWLRRKSSNRQDSKYWSTNQLTTFLVQEKHSTYPLLHQTRCQQKNDTKWRNGLCSCSQKPESDGDRFQTQRLSAISLAHKFRQVSHPTFQSLSKSSTFNCSGCLPVLILFNDDDTYNPPINLSQCRPFGSATLVMPSCSEWSYSQLSI